MYELINNIPLKIKEYNGQRVVTFRDIDMVHNRPEGTAHRNFKANRSHFIEGEDYFKVCSDEIRTNKIMNISPKIQRDIILITKSGYLMLVKSFTDDLAWSVQRQLVNTYFRVQEINSSYVELVEMIRNEINSDIEETVSRVLDRKLKAFKKSLNRHSANVITESVSETTKSLVTYFDTLVLQL